MTPEEVRRQALAVLPEGSRVTGIFVRSFEGEPFLPMTASLEEGDQIMVSYRTTRGGSATVRMSLNESGELVAISGVAAPSAERGEVPRTVIFRPTGGMDLPALQGYERDLIGVLNDPETSLADRNAAYSAWERVQIDMARLREKAATPAAAATAAKLEMEPGTVDWVGGVPIRQWAAGGTFTNLSAFPEVQAGLLDQKIAEVEAKRQELVWLSNPAFQTPGDQAAELGDIQRQIAVIDADLRLYRQARASAARQNREPGTPGVGGAGAGRTRFPSETALDEAQAAYYRARTERERLEMQGKQQQALQDYYEAIKSLETMIGNDTIKPAEADAYMALFKQNLDAALRGTTPFEESKFKAQETRQRGEVGRDLLNQRLQSSTSLANTLVGLLGSLGGKITEPFKFDPFAAARGFVTEQGGGPGVSGLATSLLQGMVPGAAGGLPTPTAEALPPDLPPELADIYRQVKAMPLATGGA